MIPWIIIAILVLASAFVFTVDWAAEQFHEHDRAMHVALSEQPAVRTISFLQNDDRARALDRIARAEAWLRAICSQNGHDYDAGPDAPEWDAGRYVPGDDEKREAERQRFMHANGFRTFEPLQHTSGGIIAMDPTGAVECYPGDGDEYQPPLPFDRNDPLLRK